VSALQAGFVIALLGVLGAMAAFTVVVARAALRSDGGPRPSARMAMRLLRSPEDRAELNRWAFYLHRLTGVAVFGFLCLHVVDVAIYALSPARFDEVHEVYGSAPMRVFECALLLAILFHTLNGLRLVAIDVADLGAAAARRLLGGVVALTGLLTVAGSAVILAPVVS
jgi:succinate dehydrogenase / fumarate reductase cytochrome b subunit